MDNLLAQLQGMEDLKARVARPPERDSELPEQSFPPQVGAIFHHPPTPQMGFFQDQMATMQAHFQQQLSDLLACLDAPWPLTLASPSALGLSLTQESMCHSDPFEPSPASSLMDLQVAVPCSPAELPDLENLSPPPESHLASALASLSNFQPPPDPFQGSALSGFGLPTVGTALAACSAGEQLADREILLWTLVRTGGGDCPKKGPKDCMECLYKQEMGVFTLPSWPASIPVTQQVVDDDKSLREIEGQWAMAALALTQGIVKLKSAVLDVVNKAEANPFSANKALASLCETINAQVAVLLVHALRLSGGYFNKLSVKR